ncbi:MAG: FHA domain-containing protein [Kofleriaceae bacterium]
MSRSAVGSPLILQDLGSTNGTLVNGKRVSVARLQIGDVLTVGAVSLRLEERSPLLGEIA